MTDEFIVFLGVIAFLVLVFFMGAFDDMVDRAIRIKKARDGWKNENGE